MSDILIDSIRIPKTSSAKIFAKETAGVKKTKQPSAPAVPVLEPGIDFVSIPITQNRLDTRPLLDKPTIRMQTDIPLTSKLQSFMDQTETVKLDVSNMPEPVQAENALEEIIAAEILFLRTYIEVMQEQRALKKSDIELANQIIHTLNDVNEKLREEHFNQSNDFLAKLKASQILGWVNKLIYGTATVLGVSSVAVTVATGGAALPAVLAIANGIAALGSGVGTIAKAILDYQHQKKLGVLEEVKLKKYLTDQKIKDGIREMGVSMREVLRNWKEIFTVVNNWTKTSLSNQR